MNAKERRHVARLEAKVRLLEEQRSEDWTARLPEVPAGAG